MKFTLYHFSVGLSLFSFIVFVYSLTLHPTFAKVSFLDIGQGDAILIDAGNGNQLLVDSGRSSGIISELGSEMKFGDNTIEVIMATHYDADHIGGFDDVMKNYSVDTLLINDAPAKTKTALTLLEMAKEKNVDIKTIKRGGMINLGNGVITRILFPFSSGAPTGNDGSIVAKIYVGGKTFLLTGDAPQKVEKQLVTKDGSLLQSNVLKLGHHGSRSASSEIFLKTVNPDVAIISAGLNNQYGHPHKEVLDLLNKLHIPYLATYRDGRLEF